MRVVIPAGGEGSGLRPLGSTVPKACVRIFDKPLIFYALDRVLPLGTESVTLALGYKANDVISLFPEGEYGGLSVCFSIEEQPSGNVGCIKTAFAEADETVLVINGDLCFDFDLTEYYSLHTKSGNDISIICTAAPRGSGDMLFDDENGLTLFHNDFADKEGLKTACFAGIYFVEPSVFKLIPDNRLFDFYENLLPLCIGRGLKVGVLHAFGFLRRLTDADSFRQIHFDIMKNKSGFVLPEVTPGVFSDGEIPKGSFFLAPPVFLGRNIQIGSGAVIGPYAVIREGCLIADGAKIHNSVVLEDVYVSSGCTVSGALICEGASLKRASSVYESAVAGACSIIGESCVITEGVCVSPYENTPNGSVIYGNDGLTHAKERCFDSNGTVCGSFAFDLSPEKAAALGEAMGSLSAGIRVGIGTDGFADSLSVKYAVLGGLVSAGANPFDFGTCFEAQMRYYSSFCELDSAFFVKGGSQGLSVTVCGSGGMPPSRDFLKKIEDILSNGIFNRCLFSECKPVNTVESMRQMYICELANHFNCDYCSLSLSFFSSNRIICECVSAALEKIGCGADNDTFIAKINEYGTRLTVIENDTVYSFERILAICAYRELNTGADVYFPWDEPQIITALADCSREAGNRCCGAQPDEEASFYSKASKQLWTRDALFLLFKFLSVMCAANKDVKTLAAELPGFYMVRKMTDIDSSSVLFSKAVYEKGFKKSESNGVELIRDNAAARLFGSADGRALRIIAEAVSAEAARELCAEVEALINNVTIDNRGK